MTDSEFLRQLAELGPNSARLLSIADQLEQSSDFDRGYKAAMDRYYAKSNLVKSARVISPESGAVLVAAIAAHPVTRVEARRGEGGPKADRLSQLGITLDLDDL